MENFTGEWEGIAFDYCLFLVDKKFSHTKVLCVATILQLPLNAFIIMTGKVVNESGC